MSDLDWTVSAVLKQNWQLVLLEPRAKRPLENVAWQITSRPGVITSHWGNLGLVCGPESGVAVLDFDRPGALANMSEKLGPLLPWVRTGSGKFHCYVKWEPDLPAKMTWNGERVGEVQRGPMQHVVVPPSIHPDTGLPYAWLFDPSAIQVEVLPDAWREHLVSEAIPSFIPVGDLSGHPEDEPWVGPSAEEILHRARQQPGAKRRRTGVKFQCGGCRKEGHDKSRDNAIVYDDGRWGCAVDPRHSRDIGEQLGIVSVSKAILGDDEDDLRDISLDDLD